MALYIRDTWKGLPQTQAITKLFPWGRVECDGTSNMAIALGRFGFVWYLRLRLLEPANWPRTTFAARFSRPELLAICHRISSVCEKLRKKLTAETGRSSPDRNISQMKRGGNFRVNLSRTGISCQLQLVRNWSLNSRTASSTGIAGISGGTSRRNLPPPCS